MTEVGRQPWVVHGYLRTEDAVTETEGLWVSFAVTFAVYAVVIGLGAMVLRHMARR